MRGRRRLWRVRSPLMPARKHSSSLAATRRHHRGTASRLVTTHKLNGNYGTARRTEDSYWTLDSTVVGTRGSDTYPGPPSGYGINYHFEFTDQRTPGA